MCGLAGALTFSNVVSPDKIGAALAQLEHRGPDFSSVRQFSDPRWGYLNLIHTRLIVIDLSADSNQPFTRGDCSLIFNGEIYNYLELRSDLIRVGIELSTSGDTEVLFEGIRHYGVAFLSRIDGMFSLAFFDGRTQKVILARDYFGEKPLYFLETDGEFFWSSEPATIWTLSGMQPRVNSAKIGDFLVAGYKSVFKTQETFFEDLSQVPSNSWLEIDLSSRRVTRGEIEPRIAAANAPLGDGRDYAEKLEALEDCIVRTFKRRFLSDVPIGLALSGGVDSMLIYAIAMELKIVDLEVFHVMNTDERYSETALFEEVMGDTRRTYVHPSETGGLSQIRAMVRTRGGPVLTPASLIHNTLTKTVSESGTKVLLGGVGADELFSGYYDHHLQGLLGTMTANPAALANEIAEWSRLVKPHVRNPFLANPNLYMENKDFRDHIYFRSRHYFEKLGARGVPKFIESLHSSSLLRNRMANELYYETVPVMLEEEDRNAMQFSIENRSPFLSKELLRVSYSFSDFELVSGGLAKKPLRIILEKSNPKVALNSRKVGFNAPIAPQLLANKAEITELIMAYAPAMGISPELDYVDGLFQLDGPNSDSKTLLSLAACAIFIDESTK
jgi:asparagine synthase (glutamine-hydrolysing)